MPKIVFTPVARQEALDAQDWYEKQSKGLGQRFRSELDRQLGRIASKPYHFAPVVADARRAPLDRFPYEIYFREKGDEIHIISCFHSSRNPTTWQKRV
ncbi:type II toxin-antitoxin system RelE/ParE family toxin [Asticcacaulis sp. AC402]|uniref:type II toxin-antitoxin system RelE/ParE family toxin n=1 Tax=Asticcacaulis sp. AC402 TaxID=1282361 RepID=UPI0003C3E6F1|nr:type II toxin-antitoxin system RelE/ParE family toxin [Asticcacaulis sp. AC402]ESQ74061.1 hypothetical protein ABAC402_16315 [Asticcacaulis sp. AC402]